MSLVRHQLLDDGRVLIVCVNGSTHSIRVSLSEAKRFAWALLSDLDPDGVFEHEAPPSKQKKLKEPPQALQLLRILCRRDMTTPDLGMAIGTTRNQAAVVLHRLKELDLVRVVMSGGNRVEEISRAPNTWGATEVGKKYLVDFDAKSLDRSSSYTGKGFLVNTTTDRTPKSVVAG